MQAVTLRVDDMDDSGSPQVGIYTDSGGEPGSLVGTAMLPVGGMTAGKNLVQFKGAFRNKQGRVFGVGGWLAQLGVCVCGLRCWEDIL